MKEKLRTDYKDEPYPAAASLVDILRATIVLDDPYALGVCAAYIQKEFAAVRLKNRFASDGIESVSVERLLSEFYTAETVGGTASTECGDAGNDLSKLSGYKQQYRDVNLNIPIKFPGREAEFVCEVQVTLSTISILKKSEQKMYSLLRMEDPAELREQYVFSRKTEEDESTVMTTHSVLSIATATGSATGSDVSSPLQEMPEDYASALSAAGLTGGTPRRIPLPVDDEDGGWMEEIPRHKEPEVIEAPVGFGVGQGMFSCACKPCEPASGDPVHVSGGAVLGSVQMPPGNGPPVVNHAP
jgi:hypothetical protein